METPRLRVEIDREEDGRWIADVIDLPGVMAYGTTREEALRHAGAIALQVIAEKLEHNELTREQSESLGHLFEIRTAA